MVDGASPVTWSMLYEQSQRVASGLLVLGVGVGDRVGIQLPPGADLVFVLNACLLVGAVAVPIDPRLAQVEQDRRTKNLALVIDDGANDWSDSVPPQPGFSPRPSDVALMLYTSGTSGAERSVNLTFGNIQANALGSEELSV